MAPINNVPRSTFFEHEYMKTNCSRCPNPRAKSSKYCLPCKAAYTREWRKTSRPEVSLVEQEIKRIKEAARSLVRHSVRRGTLTKLPCEVCGCADNVEGHHHDYLKPLDVKWLCKQHHADAHNGVQQ